MGFREERACAYCGASFVAEGSAYQKATCSSECSRELARRRQREWAAKKYVPRVNGRSPRKCEVCGEKYQPVRDTQRWCSQPCRRIGSERAKPRNKAPRVCRTCKVVELPAGQSQVRVCDNCRVDNRPNAQQRERRRQLKRYGLDQADFDRMLNEQGGRCAICRTDDPGVRGWNIDHDHNHPELGREAVRGLLCRPCNTALGFMADDVERLQAAIAYLNSFRAR